jgi:hypothetical protein
MKNINIPDLIGIKGEVRILTHKAGTDQLLRITEWMRNRVVSSDGYGRNIIARILAGDFTYTGEITHADIGTGSASVVDADTELDTGVARAQVGSVEVLNNIVTFRFFFPDSTTANNTYHELGTFIDGTATLGTGRLFNRLLLSSPYVKATGEDTTIEVKFTINP